MKNKYSAIKLKFLSPIHISSGGSGYDSSEELIHSDTLFSSICSTAKILYGDNVVEEFLNDENISVSSAFPFYDKDYFFPKPLGFYRELGRYEDEKNFKKIKYFSKELFEKIIIDEKLDEEFLKDKIINGCYSELFDNNEVILSSTEVPRVTIDRISNQTMIFHFSEVRFSEKSGLFFLYKCNNDNLRNYFLSSLRLLGDEGIGADNTIGKGLFEIEECEIEIKSSEQSDKHLLLSLYNPTENEIGNLEIESSKYDFTTRRGWVSSFSNMNLRRKSVRMLTEGSVLKFESNILPVGRMVNVLDKTDLNFLTHNIYRNGRAFTIPIK